MNPVSSLNSKRRKTLQEIFTHPTPKDIEWEDIVRLFVALGAEVDSRRSGSRMGVELSNLKVTFHVPHGYKQTKPKQIESVRNFLFKAGVKEEDVGI